MSVSIFGYEKCRKNNSKMEVHNLYVICVYFIQLLAQKVKKLLHIAHCTLHIAHCTLHIARCTSHIIRVHEGCKTVNRKMDL